jgi:predicted cupin superfamily sugar epimerase
MALQVISALNGKARMEELIERLGLTPGTCGYMSKTFESPLNVAAGSGQVRSIGAALYFLITPERGISPHRICSDQIYHHYAGDPLEVLLLHEDGHASTHLLGSRIADGMLPQLLIPAKAYHFGRLVMEGHGWGLLGTTSWPGVAEGEFEYADIDDLKAKFSGAERLIAEFTMER